MATAQTSSKSKPSRGFRYVMQATERRGSEKQATNVSRLAALALRKHLPFEDRRIVEALSGDTCKGTGAASAAPSPSPPRRAAKASKVSKAITSHRSQSASLDRP